MTHTPEELAMARRMPAYQRATLEWLAGGDTGVSSRTMALWLAFGVADKVWPRSHPADPADFGRCIRLLQTIPFLRRRLHCMGSISAEWRALVARWNDVDAVFEQEAGEARLSRFGNWRAPETYALMKEIEASADHLKGNPHDSI